jgi:hypothetical protein
MTGSGLSLIGVDLRGIINFVSPAFEEMHLQHAILPDGRLIVQAYAISVEEFGRL